MNQSIESLSNVALLLYGGHQVWFHSIATDEQVIAIYDYIEAMVRAGRYLPPPPALAPQVFDVFDWPAPEAAASCADPPPERWENGHGAIAPAPHPVRAAANELLRG